MSRQNRLKHYTLAVGVERPPRSALPFGYDWGEGPGPVNRDRCSEDCHYACWASGGYSDSSDKEPDRVIVDAANDLCLLRVNLEPQVVEASFELREHGLNVFGGYPQMYVSSMKAPPVCGGGPSSG